MARVDRDRGLVLLVLRERRHRAPSGDKRAGAGGRGNSGDREQQRKDERKRTDMPHWVTPLPCESGRVSARAPKPPILVMARASPPATSRHMPWSVTSSPKPP